MLLTTNGLTNINKSLHPIKQVIKRTKTLEKFIEDSVKLHGNKYDYSKVSFKTKSDIITIICPNHGEFKTLINKL